MDISVTVLSLHRPRYTGYRNQWMIASQTIGRPAIGPVLPPPISRNCKFVISNSSRCVLRHAKLQYAWQAGQNGWEGSCALQKWEKQRDKSERICIDSSTRQCGNWILLCAIVWYLPGQQDKVVLSHWQFCGPLQPCGTYSRKIRRIELWSFTDLKRWKNFSIQCLQLVLLQGILTSLFNSSGKIISSYVYAVRTAQ